MKAFSVPQKKKLTLDIHGAFVRQTDFSFTNLQNANLAGADATGADFTGSNLQDTNLDGTILRGADLTDVKNLTSEQLATAITDETTILPGYIVTNAVGKPTGN